MHFFNKLLVTIFVCISGSLCSMQPQDWVIAYNSDTQKIICSPEDCKKCLEEVVKLPGLKSRSELEGVLIEFQPKIEQTNQYIIHGSLLKEEKEYMAIFVIHKQIFDYSSDPEWNDFKKREESNNIQKILLQEQLENFNLGHKENKIVDEVLPLFYRSLYLGSLGGLFCVYKYFQNIPWLIYPQCCLLALGFSGMFIAIGLGVKRMFYLHKELDSLKAQVAINTSMSILSQKIDKILDGDMYCAEKSIEILSTKKDYSLEKAKNIARETYGKVLNNKK